jgi:uncharacterized phage-associated protein
MSYDPKAIANYLLARAKSDSQTLTPMKMQKLVYFAHGWHLAIKNEALINEQVEAWEFGPVIPSLYSAFRRFGDQAITEPAQRSRSEVHAAMQRGSDSPFNPTLDDCPEQAGFTKALLDKIWSVYGGYDAIQLSNMTHAEGTPWRTVFDEHNGRLPKGTDIRTDLIRDYFRSLSQK